MELKKKILLLSFAGLFILMQVIPNGRSNPPAKGAIKLPKNVEVIFKKACYDCHSNETRWPWYSYIAPISWWVIYDVNEGREELNFSTWKQLSPKKQKKLIEECWEEVEKAHMPLKAYIWTHPEAKLTQKEKDIIKAWATTKH